MAKTNKLIVNIVEIFLMYFACIKYCIIKLIRSVGCLFIRHDFEYHKCLHNKSLFYQICSRCWKTKIIRKEENINDT